MLPIGKTTGRSDTTLSRVDEWPSLGSTQKSVCQISLMRWGVIPQWAKDTSGAAMMISARPETAHTLCSVTRAIVWITWER